MGNGSAPPAVALRVSVFDRVGDGRWQGFLMDDQTVADVLLNLVGRNWHACGNISASCKCCL